MGRNLPFVVKLLLSVLIAAGVVGAIGLVALLVMVTNGYVFFAFISMILIAAVYSIVFGGNF